eukprot:TRINITY_DN1392_c0_g1_i2.p2 TRINITY_DN1392_c0_g1~~TRINITY_DN1392_c0_g1_i2.p2  ORF type:complete len:128 (-),score=6.10 TRINITY_DN1392_c0_g1_i2:1089-1472(-)
MSVKETEQKMDKVDGGREVETFLRALHEEEQEHRADRRVSHKRPHRTPSVKGSGAHHGIVEEESQIELFHVGPHKQPQETPQIQIIQQLKTDHLCDDEPRIPHHGSLNHGVEPASEGFGEESRRPRE